MNNCTICSRPIVLIPSASARAAKTGMPASFYTSLFTTHSSCAIEKRSREASETMAQAIQLRAEGKPVHVI